MRAVVRPRAEHAAFPVDAEPNEERSKTAPNTSESGSPRVVVRGARPYQHGVASTVARASVSTGGVITREQEYAFIREDLRRLLITAGILIVVMIGLLLLIDR